MSEPATPPTPPQWSSDYFREESAQAGGARPLGRGLVGHVRVVATMLIVVGVLEGFFAVFMLTAAVIALALPGREAANMAGMAILMLVLSLPAMICSVLRIIAGMYNLRFRKRTLGMVALVAGLATVFTGYCALTSIGLAVYGLIVYLNDSVVAAFELGERRRPPSEIQAVFPP